MTNPSVLAIIPARGGSKGIPRKNVRLVAGRPLIAWNLDECRRSKLLTRTVVSTDDAEIASISRQWGASIVERPPAISGDMATAEEALLHTLATLKEREGFEPDYIAYLQCTSPLTTSEDIDGAIGVALADASVDCVIPVMDFHYFLWKTSEIEKNTVGINHDARFRPRRQDREPQYLETGAVYVLRTKGFLEARHRFFGRIAMWHMPAERVQEVDEPHDLERCEYILSKRQADRRRADLQATLAKIAPKAVVFDCDGVLTDNRVLVSELGQEALLFTRSDGLGFQDLKANGFHCLVLSTETNAVVARRAEKLGVPCIFGVTDKSAALRDYCTNLGCSPSEVVYVGNDRNDWPAMDIVGVTLVPADAEMQTRRRASFVLDSLGGCGVVREVARLLVETLPRTEMD